MCACVYTHTHTVYLLVAQHRSDEVERVPGQPLEQEERGEGVRIPILVVCDELRGLREKPADDRHETDVECDHLVSADDALAEIAVDPLGTLAVVGHDAIIEREERLHRCCVGEGGEIRPPTVCAIS